jgi:hypothetical protein
LKRYRDYATYLKEIFGERVQKISLDAGLHCPNRDGTLSERGCIFCDRLGSGTGAKILGGKSLEEQIMEGQILNKRRYGARKFIAYFQSFSNTYGPLSQLKGLYDRALSHPAMVGLSVATRPDCVDEGVLALLTSYRDNYLVWLELGLQSAHDITLSKINRGHDAAAFARCTHMADRYGLNVCAHVILGLPGETREMMWDTARFLANHAVRGAKIHLLYVPRGTPLQDLYERGLCRCLEREEYADLVVDFLERLPDSVVIQRLTGEPRSSELVAPPWALEKEENLRVIRKRLEERDTWQGKLCEGIPISGVLPFS